MIFIIIFYVLLLIVLPFLCVKYTFKQAKKQKIKFKKIMLDLLHSYALALIVALLLQYLIEQFTVTQVILVTPAAAVVSQAIEYKIRFSGGHKNWT